MTDDDIKAPAKSLGLPRIMWDTEGFRVDLARLVAHVHAAERERLQAELKELRRWKSTHAPRIESLEGLLAAAQIEAHAGREAIATLASERAANAMLTGELEALRKDADRYRFLRAADHIPISPEAARDAVAYDAAIDAAMDSR